MRPRSLSRRIQNQNHRVACLRTVSMRPVRWLGPAGTPPHKSSCRCSCSVQRLPSKQDDRSVPGQRCLGTDRVDVLHGARSVSRWGEFSARASCEIQGFTYPSCTHRNAASFEAPSRRSKYSILNPYLNTICTQQHVKKNTKTPD